MFPSPTRSDQMSPGPCSTTGHRQGANSIAGSTLHRSTSTAAVEHMRFETTYSAPQIVFPQIHRPNFVCAHCLENNITCQCGGLKGQDYIMLGLPPMPLQPTRVERLARWAALVSVHPEGFNFDSKHFIQDMVNRNLLFTLATEAGRLQRMAEDHAVKLDHPSEAVRLPTLFTAGRLEGSHQSKVAAVQVMTVQAMDRLTSCDWSNMTPLDVALCQNAFQTSDPASYALGDPSLQLVFDLIGVLTAVNRLAFSVQGWHLRLEPSRN